jgi:hypothetical protein
MSEARRYLTGMFRGAYAASLLSDAHVKAPVRSVGLGKLSEIQEGIWLWELAPEQIPVAQELLDKAGLIIK